MFKVGDEVMMTEGEPHAHNPEFFPAKGSIGVVIQLIGVKIREWTIIFMVNMLGGAAKSIWKKST